MGMMANRYDFQRLQSFGDGWKYRWRDEQTFFDSRVAPEIENGSIYFSYPVILTSV